MAKDRLTPCKHYVCHGVDCKKGIRDVTMKKCQTCQKYDPRRSDRKPENIRVKRQKDKDRSDRRNPED